MVNTAFVSAALILLCIRLKLIEDNAFWAYREIVFSIVQCLNSTVNPIIYLTRKKEMRQFVLEIWRTVKDKLSRSGSDSEVNVLELTVRRVT